MLKALKSKLMLQLAIIITILIIVIELVLLVTSISSQKEMFLSIREGIQKDFQTYQNHDFSKEFPATLSDKDIEQRIEKYIVNIFVLIVIIILVVSFGTLFIFYKFAGAPILKLVQLNKQSENIKNAVRYPETDIPNNEIGELISRRNEMLDRFKNFEEELEKSVNEMKIEVIQLTKRSLIGEFTSGITHDINNPLSIILMHSDRLDRVAKDYFAENEKASKSFDKIKLAAERIQGMTAKLSEMGRNKDFSFENGVDLNAVLKNSLAFVSYMVKIFKIEIINKIEQEITCYGDIVSLENLFSNIILNACDAMENRDQKQLLIEYEKAEDDNQFIIKFTDTGIGIDPEYIDNVFERFYTTKEGKAAGLGLSICNRIVTDHCGAIDISSVPGEGTIVKVTLNKTL